MKFILLILISISSAFAEPEFDKSVAYGRQLFENTATVKLGTNKAACVQCHQNAANTHPETYPKFKKELGKVVHINERVNWCIQNALEGKPLDPVSKEMVAIISYIYKESKDVKLDPGKQL